MSEKRRQEVAARKRLEHALELLEGHLRAMRDHIQNDLPTTGARQSLVSASVQVSEQAAIVDAFRHDREDPVR